MNNTSSTAFNIIETSKKIRDIAVSFSSGSQPDAEQLKQLNILLIVLEVNIKDLEK